MINIYIITGFLGSGKTTFLNHFLKHHAYSKNLVIENEFGKINIDSRLITEKIDELVELTNGCMCCSLDNELIEVLAQIIKKDNKPENVFIETTGIADTGNIIGMIKSPEIKKHFDFKACICIVDAENIEDRLAETFETAKQISVSDIVIFNKLNSISIDYYSTIETFIREINPFARLIKSYDGSINFIELNEILDKNEFRIPTNLKNTSLKTVHKINTVYFETTDIFNFGELTYALHVNFLLYPHQLFRLKGFVNTNHNNTRYLVQSTGKHMIFTPVINTDTTTKSELVFIGLQLKTEIIKRILRPAIISSLTMIHDYPSKL
jgi:G3E family GTPase